MGEPIIGATVMVKGVTGGTITDIDGNFSIQGKVGSTLSVTYVGYAPLQVKVTSAEFNKRGAQADVCGNAFLGGISWNKQIFAEGA